MEGTMGNFSRCRRPALAALAMAVCMTAASAAQAAPAITTDAYRNIVALDLGDCIASIDRLVQRLEAGDLAGAKQAWSDARRGWERSETVTGEYFPDQDEAMDSWPDATEGFHAVEAALFGRGDATAALPVARRLAASAEALAAKLKTVRFDPQRLLNGVAGLAYEVGEGKADGEESRISGTSIYDLQHNVDGIRTLFGAVFKQPLEAADPALAQSIADQIATLGRVLHHDNFPAVDRTALRVESETLAALFVKAAGPLGLAPPTLGD
jgi:iron uptake system component EfeO